VMLALLVIMVVRVRNMSAQRRQHPPLDTGSRSMVVTVRGSSARLGQIEGEVHRDECVECERDDAEPLCRNRPRRIAGPRVRGGRLNLTM
jgi:hypothetical protein